MIAIREIREGDAEKFLALCHQLDQETQFMLLEPGERVITVEKQRKRIKGILSRDNQTILVAEDQGGQLVGHLTAFGGIYNRNRHTVDLVIGILQGFTGQGIGTQMFTQVEEWARTHAIHRLELTVMVHNERALKLYQKIGFEIEGLKKHHLRVNDKYVDEYEMAKLLE
jgi:RimJ/RimL family protein N-acetyltransferase